MLQGKALPVAWSPASSLEVDRFLSSWQMKHGNQDIILTSEQRPLYRVLVFAVWNQYADLLLKNMAKSIGPALRMPSSCPMGGKALIRTNPRVMSILRRQVHESNSGC